MGIGHGDRLPHQHDAKRDVQDAEKHLPDEPAPSFGPERVDHLEGAGNDGDPSNKMVLITVTSMTSPSTKNPARIMTSPSRTQTQKGGAGSLVTPIGELLS